MHTRNSILLKITDLECKIKYFYLISIAYFFNFSIYCKVDRYKKVVHLQLTV